MGFETKQRANKILVNLQIFLTTLTNREMPIKSTLRLYLTSDRIPIMKNKIKLTADVGKLMWKGKSLFTECGSVNWYIQYGNQCGGFS